MLPWFERRRSQQLADYDRENPQRAQLLRQLDALYLFATIGMEAVLKSDGTVLVAVDEDWDQPDRPAPLFRPATEQERTASLVIAQKRIPELAQLLPPRPADAIECDKCRGSGYIIQQVVCGNCGGMGWIAPAA